MCRECCKEVHRLTTPFRGQALPKGKFFKAFLSLPVVRSWWLHCCPSPCPHTHTYSILREFGNFWCTRLQLKWSTDGGEDEHINTGIIAPNKFGIMHEPIHSEKKYTVCNSSIIVDSLVEEPILMILSTICTSYCIVTESASCTGRTRSLFNGKWIIHIPIWIVITPFFYFHLIFSSFKNLKLSFQMI